MKKRIMKKCGFTVAELLVTMLIVLIVAAAIVPIIGPRKIKHPREISNHGLFQCYWEKQDDGNFHLIQYTRDIKRVNGAENPQPIDITEKNPGQEYCKFTVPKANFFKVEMVGSGGNGGGFELNDDDLPDRVGYEIVDYDKKYFYEFPKSPADKQIVDIEEKQDPENINIPYGPLGNENSEQTTGASNIVAGKIPIVPGGFYNFMTNPNARYGLGDLRDFYNAHTFFASYFGALKNGGHIVPNDDYNKSGKSHGIFDTDTGILLATNTTDLNELYQGLSDETGEGTESVSVFLQQSVLDNYSSVASLCADYEDDIDCSEKYVLANNPGTGRFGLFRVELKLNPLFGYTYGTDSYGDKYTLSNPSHTFAKGNDGNRSSSLVGESACDSIANNESSIKEILNVFKSKSGNNFLFCEKKADSSFTNFVPVDMDITDGISGDGANPANAGFKYNVTLPAVNYRFGTRGDNSKLYSRVYPKFHKSELIIIPGKSGNTTQIITVDNNGQQKLLKSISSGSSGSIKQVNFPIMSIVAGQLSTTIQWFPEYLFNKLTDLVYVHNHVGLGSVFRNISGHNPLKESIEAGKTLPPGTGGQGTFRIMDELNGETSISITDSFERTNSCNKSSESSNCTGIKWSWTGSSNNPNAGSLDVDDSVCEKLVPDGYYDNKSIKAASSDQYFCKGTQGAPGAVIITW